MTQTIMTIGQLLQYKKFGAVQLDLFPEELEHAKREQNYKIWLAVTEEQPEPQPVRIYGLNK
jgi:hypothetical protein